MGYLLDLAFLLILFQQPITHAPGQFLAVPPVKIYRACPETGEILHQIRRNIKDTLSEFFSSSVSECGDGLWYRVAYLNMTDPSQQCPPAWREYNNSGVRACGRPASNGGSRPATLYPTNRQYSRVCGRAIGFQVGNPDAFSQFHARSLDQGYMDGISITHGQPRCHIWSYAASLSENSTGEIIHVLSDQESVHHHLLGIITSYCESANPEAFITPLFYAKL